MRSTVHTGNTPNMVTLNIPANDKSAASVACSINLELYAKQSLVFET